MTQFFYPITPAIIIIDFFSWCPEGRQPQRCSFVQIYQSMQIGNIHNLWMKIIIYYYDSQSVMSACLEIVLLHKVYLLEIKMFSSACKYM